METGAILHEPSEPELVGWKVQRTLLGLVLLVVAFLGVYLSLMGMTVDSTAGDGAAMVTLVTLGAGVAIGFFGLRYVLLGLRGGGVVFHERAVTADFQRGLAVLPRRRTVPLLHVRVSGGPRLTTATAVTTTGHAFRVPAQMVERLDASFLGSLGTRPVSAAGGSGEDGTLEGGVVPYRHPAPDPLPDHGPAWPDPGRLPITVDVEVEPGPEARPAPPGPAGAPRAASPAPAAPAPAPGVPPRKGPAPPAPAPPPATPPEAEEEPEMEVLMDLPDVVPPPETGAHTIPPPPRYRPPDIKVPEPPAHREMGEGPPATPPPGTPRVVPQEQAQSPPVEAPPPPEEPAPPPTPSDEWELEELPPPGERKRPPPPGGGDWEEL